jgi:serine/threonine-protein kinase
MPVCGRCNRDWPDQFWACPEDGTVLTVATVGGDRVALTAAGIAREPEIGPGTMIGEYRVEGPLGEGGMATVYAAIHPVISKRVAIKVISRRLCTDLHAVERFIGEARTVNQVGHPNLVDIFAFGVLPDGRAYLVMEWLQGETLAQLLSRQRLTLPRSIDVLIQLCDALEAAHDKRVVHRDLKPANIFLVDRPGTRTKDAPTIGSSQDRSFAVKLLDFGIAKLADSDASVPKTRSGVAMGTAGYMSPEQARNKNVDYRTDVYALGCVAYEMILGRLPFVADSAIDILAMHLASQPPLPRSLSPDVPPALERLMLEMLAKEPDGRPPVAAIRARLHEIQRTVAPRMGVPSSVNGKMPSRRKPILIAAVATMTLAASAFVGLRLIVPPPPDDLPPSLQPPQRPVPAPVPQTNSAAAVPIVRTGTLVVKPSVEAQVRIDGVAYDPGPDGVTVDVPEGDHVVEVIAPHRPSVSQHTVVAAGVTATLRIPVPPAAPKKRPAESPSGDYTLDPF